MNFQIEILHSWKKAYIKRSAINLEIEDEQVSVIKINTHYYPINSTNTEQITLENLYDLTLMVFTDKIAEENKKNWWID